MSDRSFDKALFIRDYDITTDATRIFYVPEEVWKDAKYEVTDDPITAPIQPMIAKGAIVAAVPETNPQGANCYLVNLADLWITHDPKYKR